MTKEDLRMDKPKSVFFDEYKGEFGEWRLIFIDKVRLSFERLESVLIQHESFEATIDPRKGSA